MGGNEATAPEAAGVKATVLPWPCAPGNGPSAVFDPAPWVAVLPGSVAKAAAGAGAGVNVDVDNVAGEAGAKSNLGGRADTGTGLGPAPGVTPPSGVGAIATGLGGGGAARGGAGAGTGGGTTFGGVGGKMGGLGPVPGGTPTGSGVLTRGATSLVSPPPPCIGAPLPTSASWATACSENNASDASISKHAHCM